MRDQLPHYQPARASMQAEHLIESFTPGEEGLPLFGKLSTLLHYMISRLHEATWHMELFQEMGSAGQLAFIVNTARDEGALANVFKHTAEILHDVAYMASHVDEYAGREDVESYPLKGFVAVEMATWTLRSTVTMIAAYLNNNPDLKDVWSPIELGVCSVLESLGDLRHECQTADDHLQTLSKHLRASLLVADELAAPTSHSPRVKPAAPATAKTKISSNVTEGFPA